MMLDKVIQWGPHGGLRRPALRVADVRDVRELLEAGLVKESGDRLFVTKAGREAARSA